MTYTNEDAARSAEIMARATGSRGATYQVERRMPDGSLQVEASGSYGDTTVSTPLPAGVLPDRQVATKDAKIGTTEPRVGLRILVPNAGGAHQSPGSYGYTETTILAVESKMERSGGLLWRVETVAFGMGCWRSGKFTVRESMAVPAGGTGDEGLVGQGRCSLEIPHAAHPMRGANTVAFLRCSGN